MRVSSLAAGAVLFGMLAMPLAAPLHAETAPQKAGESAAPVVPALTLDEALARARGDQPSVAAYEQDARASEQAAFAARSLPDPQFSAGVQDFPVEGKHAFSPTKDDFTMYVFGIMREQVRRSKREARASQLIAEAAVSRQQGSVQQLHIGREVTIAWIDAVEAVVKERLLARVVSDLRTGQKIMEAGVSTGASSPALALEAQAEVALAGAQLADAKAAEAKARGALGRWIGSAAQRPLPDSVPNLGVPNMQVDRMEEHPHIRVAEAQEEAARRGVAVAQTDRRPDVTWSVSYGFRPSFGDMVSAQVSIPLQINRKGLQDRKIAEAQARDDAARLRVEDMRRDLAGQYASAIAEHEGAEAQLDILRKQAIPSLEASFKAAEARYSGGQGTLERPLEIVRRYVETNIRFVELEAKRARAAAELIYLAGGTAR
jgi:outer membrane protein, heavy metal efflux system